MRRILFLLVILAVACPFASADSLSYIQVVEKSGFQPEITIQVSNNPNDFSHAPFVSVWCIDMVNGNDVSSWPVYVRENPSDPMFHSMAWIIEQYYNSPDVGTDYQSAIWKFLSPDLVISDAANQLYEDSLKYGSTYAGDFTVYIPVNAPNPLTPGTWTGQAFIHVPEPQSILLLGAGMLGVGLMLVMKRRTESLRR